RRGSSPALFSDLAAPDARHAGAARARRASPRIYQPPRADGRLVGAPPVWPTARALPYGRQRRVTAPGPTLSRLSRVAEKTNPSDGTRSVVRLPRRTGRTHQHRAARRGGLWQVGLL